MDETNNQVTQSGLSIARKSMSSCGLHPNVDGVWETEPPTIESRSKLEQQVQYLNGVVTNLLFHCWHRNEFMRTVISKKANFI